jgi:tetratricopeptide (TPR) repeat protein
MKYEVGKQRIGRGDLARAERYFRSLDPYALMHYVPAQYQLGRIYEAMGEPEKARDRYLIVLNWWRDADPYLEPWRAEVEEALRRLSPDA